MSGVFLGGYLYRHFGTAGGEGFAGGAAVA